MWVNINRGFWEKQWSLIKKRYHIETICLHALCACVPLDTFSVEKLQYIFDLILLNEKKTQKSSAVWVLITQLTPKFHAMLEESHSSMQFFQNFICLVNLAYLPSNMNFHSELQ